LDHKISLRLAIAALVALSLAGCGRKGPLELPASNAPTPPLDALENRILPQQDSPGLIQPPNRYAEQPVGTKLDQAAQKSAHPINAPAAPATKPFFLDPLL
jgi:predicted small lipoprotein YifL